MKPSGCISCEYHVVYSSSYEIPVLYFNMHTTGRCQNHLVLDAVCYEYWYIFTDGRLLTLDQIWKLVPHQQHERLEGNLWSLVTQSVGVESDVLVLECMVSVSSVKYLGTSHSWKTFLPDSSLSHSQNDGQVVVK